MNDLVLINNVLLKETTGAKTLQERYGLQDTKSKAEKALAPLDYNITGVKNISLSEFRIPYPQPTYKTAFVELFNSQTPVFTSDQYITISVQVVFLIKNN